MSHPQPVKTVTQSTLSRVRASIFSAQSRDLKVSRKQRNCSSVPTNFSRAHSILAPHTWRPPGLTRNLQPVETIERKGPGRAASPAGAEWVKAWVGSLLHSRLAAGPPSTRLQALAAAQPPCPQLACLRHPAWSPRSGNRTAALGPAVHSQPERFHSPDPVKTICWFGMVAMGAERKTSVRTLLSPFPCSSEPADRARDSSSPIFETATGTTAR